MDEQLLRIRIAALETAITMVTSGGRNLVNNDTFVTDVAARFEYWLTRGATVADVREHDAETVADRIGYERCPTTWRDKGSVPAGSPHRCLHPPGHEDFPRIDHRCSCGDVLDASSAKG